MKRLSEKLKGFPHLESQRRAVVKLEEELALWERYMNKQCDLVSRGLDLGMTYAGVSIALQSVKARLYEKLDTAAEKDARIISHLIEKVRWSLDIIEMEQPAEPWGDGIQEGEAETIIHTLRSELNEYSRVLDIIT